MGRPTANLSYAHSYSKSGHPVRTANSFVLEQASQRPRYVAASTAEPQLHVGTSSRNIWDLPCIGHEDPVNVVPMAVVEHDAPKEPQQVCLQGSVNAQVVSILSQHLCLQK